MNKEQPYRTLDKWFSPIAVIHGIPYKLIPPDNPNGRVIIEHPISPELQKLLSDYPSNRIEVKALDYIEACKRLHGEMRDLMRTARGR